MSTVTVNDTQAGDWGGSSPEELWAQVQENPVLQWSTLIFRGDAAVWFELQLSRLWSFESTTELKLNLGVCGSCRNTNN